LESHVRMLSKHHSLTPPFARGGKGAWNTVLIDRATRMTPVDQRALDRSILVRADDLSAADRAELYPGQRIDGVLEEMDRTVSKE
jgi:hypothetical protein